MPGKGKSLLDSLKNNKSLINLSSLLTGNFTSVLIPILISPILTRLFTESDFGLLTLYTSLLTIFLSFSTGRLDFAILEAKTKSIASHLFFGSIFFSISGTISCLLLGIIIIPSIGGYNSEILYGVLILLVSAILIGSVTQSIRYLLNREEYYKELAIIKVFRSGNSALAQITGGYLIPHSLTLLIGKYIGDVLTLVISIWYTIKNKLLIFRFEKYKFKYVLNKYSKYYRINSIHALFNATSSNILPIVFVWLFTIDETGYYGLSFRVCFLPITVISGAIFQIFSREFAKRTDSQTSTVQLFKKILLGMLTISVIPFLILLIFGPDLFSWFFGENWTESGKYAQILSPYILVVFLVSPFTFVPVRLNKHVKSFYIEIVNTVLRLIALFLGAQFNVYVALSLYAFVGFVTQTYLLIWIYGLVKREKKLIL